MGVFSLLESSEMPAGRSQQEIIAGHLTMSNLLVPQLRSGYYLKALNPAWLIHERPIGKDYLTPTERRSTEYPRAPLLHGQRHEPTPARQHPTARRKPKWPRREETHLCL